jgi:hypothetical protein
MQDPFGAFFFLTFSPFAGSARVALIQTLLNNCDNHLNLTFLIYIENHMYSFFLVVSNLVL